MNSAQVVPATQRTELGCRTERAPCGSHAKAGCRSSLESGRSVEGPVSCNNGDEVGDEHGCFGSPGTFWPLRLLQRRMTCSINQNKQKRLTQWPLGARVFGITKNRRNRPAPRPTQNFGLRLNPLRSSCTRWDGFETKQPKRTGISSCSG